MSMRTRLLTPILPTFLSAGLMAGGVGADPPTTAAPKDAPIQDPKAALAPDPKATPALDSSAAPGQDPEIPAEEPAGPRYSLEVSRQDIEVTLLEFAKRSGMPISVPDLPTQLITLSFKDLPFEKALRQILAAGSLDYRKVDGGFVVGMPQDLKLAYPSPGEKDLDATYRCRRVGAASLAEAIRTVLPDLKVTTGPIFLSPPLDNGGTNGGDAQLKALGPSDVSFKTHDVLFSGPAALVRRALTLAQKFDRPRKQVRIAIKIISVTSDQSKQLGIDWPAAATFSATEQSVAAGTSSSPALVDGIRLGKFSHTPLVVSATLNALEVKGKAKTLSNPTIMLLDGERAFILSGQKELLPTYKGKDQNGQSIYDTQEYKIGIYLQVGVQIGLDNDMVLSLYPQVTSIQGYNTINGAQYPTINTSEEHTTVRASSGEVIVLGGMLKDASTTGRKGLPFLGQIPFLGKLFSSESDTKDKEELMIILTPELVDETLPKSDMKMSVTTPAP